MRIVHLSDYHLKSDSIKDTSEFLSKALIADLKKYNDEVKIDLIVFSGDLIDKGGKSFGNIKEAFSKFEEIVILPILLSLNLSRDNFIFIPGNHDVDRSADSVNIEAGLRSNLKTIEAVSRHIDNGKLEGIKRIIPFKDFEIKFHENQSKGITNYHSCYVIEIQGKKVGITGFNSAWRCYDSDKDYKNVIVGTNQFRDANEFINGCDIKIALMHHQFDCLADFESEVIQKYIEDEYDMLFCGHIHKGSSFHKYTESSDIFCSIAPSNSMGNLWSNDQRFINGYSIIDFDFATKTFIINHRKYSYMQRSYIPNTDLAPNNGISSYGKTKYSTKPEFELSESEKIQEESKDISFNRIINSSDYSFSNITANNNSLNYILSNYNYVFEKYIQEIMEESDLCKEIYKNIGNLLFLFDRFLNYLNLMCEEVINNFNIYIEAIEKNNTKNKCIKELFGFLDLWLIKFKEMFNYEIDDLQLENDDIVIDLLKSAKQNIQLIKIGKTEKLLLQSDIAIILEILICIILPIYSKQDEIVTLTKNIKISELTSEEVKENLSKLINEYNSHLSVFKGKDNLIDEMVNNIINYNYIIIYGDKETGKSALIAKSVAELSKRFNCDLSPLVILFSFKYTKSISEMVLNIVEQCNTIIINKLDEEVLFKFTRTQEIQEEHSLLIDKYDILKTYFDESIKRVIRECGEIFVIIDSVDLIDQHFDKILFILGDIPENCHLIIGTAKDGTKWETKNTSQKKILTHLSSIMRSEIPIFSGVDDVNEENIKTNDIIFSKTKGQISKLRKIVESYNDETDIGDLSILELIEEDSETFGVIGELCVDNNVLEEALLLLALFEPIEPILLEHIQLFLNYKGINYRMPKIRTELKKLGNQISDLRFKRISLQDGNFASFILYRFFSSKDVEDFIISVFDWLSNSYINKELICKFIIYSYSSKIMSNERFTSEINNFIDAFVKLENNRHLYNIGLYLFYELKDEVELALKFLFKASELNNSEAKSFLGYIYSIGEKVEKDITKAEQLLRDSSKMNNMKAKRILGDLLLEGIEIRKNIDEGEKLLYEAVELGSKSAKLDIAFRLILGKDITRDFSRGQQMMDELIEDEYVDAMNIMGLRYLYGGGINRDVEKGKILLKKAIAKGDNFAKLSLAKYIISNDTEVTQGIKYLTDLVDLKDIEAKRFYARILLTGLGVKKDIEKGMVLLKELVKIGDQESKYVYSKILIDGKYTHQNIHEGRSVLESLVKEHYVNAMSYLGDLLIDGQYVDRDTENGLSLLYEASDLGDILSKVKLAIRLINGLGVEKDYNKAKQLFCECIEKGDVDAKYQYGKSLLNKKELSESERAEAIDLIKDAAFLGNSNAKKYLGVILLEGKKVEKDLNKGLEYINEAISLNNEEAMRELGYRLLFGINVPKDAEKAEKLLLKAINYDDILAKTILGQGVLMGELDTYETLEGVRLLEEAAQDERNAMRIFGVMLLEGIHIDKDKNRGEELLRNAVKRGDNFASLHLARLLLDGKYLPVNLDEGRRLLQNMVDEEDESAIIEISNRLIDGKGFSKDIQKGLEYLERLALNGNQDARYEYSYWLILGNNSTKNISKGEKILRDAVDEGHEDSRRFLAQCLIDETLENRIENEGIKLIEKCIESNDFEAMRYFSGLLLEGNYIEKDVDRAIQLYEKAIKGRNLNSKVDYALRLLNGGLIPKNTNKGLTLLNDAIQNGSQKAKFYLASNLFEGDLIEKDFDKGLKLLNQLIEDGYGRAKHFLASHLIYGDRIGKNTEEGISYFEGLVKEENIPATFEYSELLIEGIYVPKNETRGEKLLRNLSQKGDMNSCYALAKRYLTGNGLRKHVKNGKERLIKAGNSLKLAMLEYGLRLKMGNKFPKDEIKGNGLIDKAIRHADTSDLYDLGVLAYEFEEYQLSTELLYKAFINGSFEAGNSLAYMCRRNEVRGQHSLPSVDKLLEKGLANNYDTSIINFALQLIKDQRSDDEWRNADLIIKNLDRCGSAANWWFKIANEKDDVEGHLVIGWLVKHNKISDPKSLDYKERFDKVLDKGLYIPNWLFNDVYPKPSDLKNKDNEITNLIS